MGTKTEFVIQMRLIERRTDQKGNKMERALERADIIAFPSLDHAEVVLESMKQRLNGRNNT